LLKDSVASMQRDELRAALADAASFGFGRADGVAGEAAVAAAKALLGRVEACDAALAAATASLETSQLEAAAEDARSFGYGDADAQPPVAGVAQLAAATVRVGVLENVCVPHVFGD
jgi:hypothetical protein